MLANAETSFGKYRYMLRLAFSSPEKIPVFQQYFTNFKLSAIIHQNRCCTFNINFRSTDEERLIENYFTYFSTKLYVVGTHKNCLKETVLLCTQNVIFTLLVIKLVLISVPTIYLSYCYNLIATHKIWNPDLGALRNGSYVNSHRPTTMSIATKWNYDVWNNFGNITWIM